MRRFVLIHDGQRILLPPGRTLIGRGLDCKIRFNDPAVSRRHLAIEIANGRAVVSNLSTRGTLFNSGALNLPQALAEGDVLRLGHRTVHVEVVESPDSSSSVSLGSEGAADEDALAEERTRPGFEADDSGPAEPMPVELGRMSLESLSDIDTHTCPKCRADVSYDESTCHQCGFVWPPEHPSGVTQEINIELVKRRASRRYQVVVPVIYSSSTLTIDAMVRDLSRGGMFIETELLDPVATRCEVTALPDGYPALQFRGVVVRVADEGARVGARSGIGLQIVGGTDEALDWLKSVLVEKQQRSGD